MTIEERLRVGVVVVPKKWQKHGFSSCSRERIQFIQLTPSDLFASQLSHLRLNIILHKISDWLLSPTELSRIAKELWSWGGRVIDWDVSLLADRRKTCDLLRWFAPLHGLQLPLTGECSDLLNFPVIRKPVSACSAKDSHSMSLFYRAKQVSGGAEHILQEYVPHHGVLFKIYVIGSAIRMQLRPSLRAKDDGKPLEFNSQLMKQSGNVRDDPEAHAHAVSIFERHEKKICSFSMALKEELGLTLFGWDLLFEEGTERLFVIDVNYFPGFDEIGFLDLLCDALIE